MAPAGSGTEKAHERAATPCRAPRSDRSNRQDLAEHGARPRGRPRRVQRVGRRADRHAHRRAASDGGRSARAHRRSVDRRGRRRLAGHGAVLLRSLRDRPRAVDTAGAHPKPQSAGRQAVRELPLTAGTRTSSQEDDARGSRAAGSPSGVNGRRVIDAATGRTDRRGATEGGGAWERIAPARGRPRMTPHQLSPRSPTRAVPPLQPGPGRRRPGLDVGPASSLGRGVAVLERARPPAPASLT
jgi:hypothetical protein